MTKAVSMSNKPIDSGAHSTNVAVAPVQAPPMPISAPQSVGGLVAPPAVMIRPQPTAVPPPPKAVAPVIGLAPQGVPAPPAMMMAPRPNPVVMMQPRPPQPMMNPRPMLGELNTCAVCAVKACQH